MVARVAPEPYCGVMTTNQANSSTTNPWKALAQEREARYGAGGTESAYERAAIEGEYAGTDAYATPCPCGSVMEYRATVGALICPDCRQMAHTNGVLIGGPRK